MPKYKTRNIETSRRKHILKKHENFGMGTDFLNQTLKRQETKPKIDK